MTSCVICPYHVAKAVSVHGLREQVVSRCPEGTPVPSDEWICLQFAPTSLSSHTIALCYTGKLEVKRQVQQTHFRKSHPDSHYATCLIDTRESMQLKYVVMLCLFASMIIKRSNLASQHHQLRQQNIWTTTDCTHTSSIASKHPTTTLPSLVSYLL